MVLLLPKLALLLLAAWGFWTLWGFPYTNGLLRMLEKLSAPGASIPGPTFAPMKQKYTGIKLLDTQLTTLVGFFFTVIDGNRPDVSLAGLALGGQVVAAWMLMTTESLRWGNQGKAWVTSITFLGLLMQNIGFACIAPIWMAIHLWQSPTVVHPRDYQLIASSPIKLAMVPISVIVGYGIPSVIMSLAAPTKISFERKQTWAAVQQAWPIWVFVLQTSLTITLTAINPMVSVLTEADKKARAIKYLRRVYAFGVMSSVSGHAVSWGISLLAYAFPVLFNTRFLAELQPSNIFLPVLPFGPQEAETLADGALWFLQWDMITGASAVLVWALTLRVAAKHEEATLIQSIVGITMIAVSIMLLGPAGTAVVAVWSRDELVFKKAATVDAQTAVTKKCR